MYGAGRRRENLYDFFCMCNFFYHAHLSFHKVYFLFCVFSFLFQNETMKKD